MKNQTELEAKFTEASLKVQNLEHLIMARKAEKIKKLCLNNIPVLVKPRGQNYYDIVPIDSEMSDALFEVKLVTKYLDLGQINDICINYCSNSSLSSSESKIDTLIKRSEALLAISQNLKNSEQFIVNELSDINEAANKEYESLLKAKFQARELFLEEKKKTIVNHLKNGIHLSEGQKMFHYEYRNSFYYTRPNITFIICTRETSKTLQLEYETIAASGAVIIDTITINKDSVKHFYDKLKEFIIN